MEKTMETKNPFGISTRLDLRTAAKSLDGAEPKTDFVGIFLGAVPALEKSREALEKVSEGLAGSEVCSKCEEWCEKIRALEVEIMESAINAVRGDLAQGQAGELDPAAALPGEALPEAPAEQITPDMISGRQDIPKSLLSK
jgi:hypothetical protein